MFRNGGEGNLTTVDRLTNQNGFSIQRNTAAPNGTRFGRGCAWWGKAVGSRRPQGQ